MATLSVCRIGAADGADGAVDAVRPTHCTRAAGRLQEAATVRWGPDAPTPTTRQLRALRAPGARGAMGGGSGGLLFGRALVVPVLGPAGGAAAGAPAPSPADVGIDDRFLHQVRARVNPGTRQLVAVPGPRAQGAPVATSRPP